MLLVVRFVVWIVNHSTTDNIKNQQLLTKFHSCTSSSGSSLDVTVGPVPFRSQVGQEMPVGVCLFCLSSKHLALSPKKYLKLFAPKIEPMEQDPVLGGPKAN